VLDFSKSVDLPVCFDDLGIGEPPREEIRAVAEATYAMGETIHATWFDVTADQVEAAIWAAGAKGKTRTCQALWEYWNCPASPPVTSCRMPCSRPRKLNWPWPAPSARESYIIVMGGKGFLLLCGDVGAVKASVAAGIDAIKSEGMLVNQVVISGASETLFREHI
jgi:hypothetical protein